MDWFTADWHLFHNNIMRYCGRPFKNVEQMNNKLIKNYNQCVTSADTCYFLGDMAMLNAHNIYKLKPILFKLNGRKVLILGNHDDGKPFTYISLGFESVHTSLEINNMLLIHEPPKTIDVDKTKKCLVGHIHKSFKLQGNCLNVGVDVWDFYPVSGDTIFQEFRNIGL